ncbi:MAG TPA: MFS transporter, partial [Nevskiaceae bacterium]|nr:MFS transporter [Nevskiaceae bacterium]
ITDAWSWQWLFLINLAPGIAVAAAVWTLLDIDRPEHKLWRILDLPGTVYMMLFLGSLEWVLEEGPAHNWLDDGGIAFWTATMCVSALLFFHRVLTHHNPIVSLRPFINPHFIAANAAAMLLSVSLFAANYIVPLFLGQVRGFNSMQIGDALAVNGIAMFLAAPFAARLARKFDLRYLFTFGCLLVLAGSAAMCTLTDQTGYWELFWPQGVRSLGFMLALVCCSTLSLSTLPPDMIKNASGLYTLMRNLGGALGLACLNTIMFWRGAVHQQHLSEALRLSRVPVRDLALQAGAQAPHDAILSVALVAHRLGVQSLVLAYNDALIAITWVGAIAIPVFLFVKRPRLTGGPAMH